MPVFVLGGDSIDFEDTTATTNDVKIGKTFIDSNGDLVLGLLDQSDATATSEQIKVGYTAYNNFEKIIGTMDQSDATANSAQILSGYTAYNNFEKITGTMTNRGAISKLITLQDDVYTIPEGYHNGEGKVTVIVSNLWHGTIAYGVNVGGITGSYTGLGNATTSQVLEGCTFSTSSLSNATGTMSNRPAYTNTSDMVLGDSHALNFYIRFPQGAYITPGGGGEGKPELIVSSSTIATTIYHNRNGVANSNLNMRDDSNNPIGVFNSGHWLYCTDRTDVINGNTMRFCLIPCWMLDSAIGWRF